MHIVVCIKQVPDSAQIRVHPVTNTIMRQGVPTIINPYDLFAIEEALRLRETVGGEVTVLTMGPPSAEDSLRKALTFGADRAVLLTDRFFAGADTLATTYALAAAIRKIGETSGRRTSCSPASRRSTAIPRRSAPGSPSASVCCSSPMWRGSRARPAGAQHRGGTARGRRHAGAAQPVAVPHHHARRHQRHSPRPLRRRLARRACHGREMECAGRRRRGHREVRPARLADHRQAGLRPEPARREGGP